jgi:hypothetical protein
VHDCRVERIEELLACHRNLLAHDAAARAAHPPIYTQRDLPGNRKSNWLGVRARGRTLLQMLISG